MPARLSRMVRAAPATAVLVVAVVSPILLAAPASAQHPADPGATTVAPGPVDPAATTVAPAPPPADPAATTVATVAEPETERLDDPDARRTINLLIGILIGLAVLVLIVTAWFWRATRPVAAALEPLAAMSTRRFRRKSPDEQEGELHALHELKSATDPPPRAADLLRQVSGDDA
jgi:hypothetical protein